MMNGNSNTSQALAIALSHSPYLTRRLGIVSKELNATLQKVAPRGKEIAAALYEEKMEREADNRQWKKIKVLAMIGSFQISIFKTWAYYAPSGPQDFKVGGDFMAVSDATMLWVSRKTIKRFVRHLAPIKCVPPCSSDFEMIKRRRRGLKFDRTLARIFVEGYQAEVQWYVDGGQIP